MLEKKWVFLGYINVIKDLYGGVVTGERTTNGNASKFLITVGLCQNFLVLVDETKVGINYKLKLWRSALEFKGFRLCRVKN